MIKIRNMNARDCEAAVALWKRTAGMGLNSADDSPQGIARYLARNPRTSFVAKEDGAVIGTILCGHDGRRGYIYHAAVLPEFRGRGTGRALVEAALSALEAEGIRKAALVVFSENDMGNAFWEHLGFSVRTDLTYRNRERSCAPAVDSAPGSAS